MPPDDTFTFDELLNYDPAQAGERYTNNNAARKAKVSAGRQLGRPLGVKNGEGKRENKPLTRLTHRHYEMIALHLRGRALKAIAEEVGCTYATAWRVLNDPLSRQIIEEFYEAHKVDLMGLFPVAIDAVRKGLENEDTKTRLLAVDRFIKLKESTEGRSEDASQVNITIVNDARTKLVTAIKDKVPVLKEQPDGSFEATE